MNRCAWHKQSAAFALALILLCGALCGVTPLTASAQDFGDIDGNGTANMRDSMLLYQYAGGKVSLTAQQLVIADLDGNGTVNMRDALKLFRVASGKEELVPPASEDALTPITADQYYGRQLLAASGKTDMLAAYDEIGAAIANFETDIALYSHRLSLMEMERVFRYYIDDHPEAFWVSGSFRYSYFKSDGAQYAYMLYPQYCCTAGEAAALNAELKTRTEELLDGLTDQIPQTEREKTVHDRLLRSADYDQTYQAEHTHDLLGVMLNGTGVCESYARAFQYLMQRCGIPAALAVGYTQGSSAGHMWNVVQIDGNWYQVDPTWNDPILATPIPSYVRYDYFNITTARMLGDHQIAADISHFGDEAVSYPVPECTATEAQWTSYCTIAVTGYDAQMMGEALAKAIQNGEYLYFRAADGYSFAQLKADMENGNRFWAMMDVANAILGDDALAEPRYYVYEDADEGIYGMYLFE